MNINKRYMLNVIDSFPDDSEEAIEWNKLQRDIVDVKFDPSIEDIGEAITELTKRNPKYTFTAVTSLNTISADSYQIYAERRSEDESL